MLFTYKNKEWSVDYASWTARQQQGVSQVKWKKLGLLTIKDFFDD